MSFLVDSPMVVRSLRAGGVLRTNRAFDAVVHLEPTTLAEQDLHHWIHPEDREGLEGLIESGVRITARHTTGDGGWVPLAWDIRIADGAPVVLGRPPAGEVGASERPKPDEMTPSRSLGQTLDAMARVVESKNPGMRCSILLVGPCGRGVSVGAGPSLPANYNEAVEGLLIGPTVGSCGTAAFWNIPVVVENIAEDPLWRDLRPAAALAGVCACWSVPIHSTGGDVLGAMALYADEPRAPMATQMDGLEIASRMVGLAIERDTLEQQLRDAEKMKAIGRLAGGVAHNFNNLLTVILGHVDMMRERPDRLPDPDTLDTIIRAVRDGSAITGQLLAFGRDPVQRAARTDLNEALGELVRALDPLIGDEVTMSVETDPAARWIAVDRGHLGQIMLNLMLNARDALEDGGHVRLCTRRATSRDAVAVNAPLPASSYVAVTMTDNGVGMDATTLDRAFEPFFSTKEVQGTGLGLATVYALASQNGAYVSLESEVGTGTTVTLLLPRCDSARPASESEEGPVEAVASVLVAEDNDEIRDLIVRVLTGAGYHVTEARNGADAWALCEGGQGVDLLVTDVMMARMGGAELAKRVRARLPDARVLFISGHAFDRLKLPELDPAHEMYLAKPFSPAQLRDHAVRALAL